MKEFVSLSDAGCVLGSVMITALLSAMGLFCSIILCWRAACQTVKGTWYCHVYKVTCLKLPESVSSGLTLRHSKADHEDLATAWWEKTRFWKHQLGLMRSSLDSTCCLSVSSDNLFRLRESHFLIYEAETVTNPDSNS